MMDKRNIKKWVKALRSGRYSQTQETLQDESGHCCLGVACEIFIPKKLQQRYSYSDEPFLIGDLPNIQEKSPKWLKDMDKNFSKKTGHHLSVLNDQTITDENSTDIEPLTFDEIADLLEAVYIYKVLGNEQYEV